MLILTCEQTRTLERTAVELGRTYRGLMEKAGEQAALFIREKLPNCRKELVILCGNGNNGGDGFVVARLLSRWTEKVLVVLVNGEPKTEDAMAVYRLAQKEESVTFCSYDSLNIERQICSADLIVDAIYGIGFHGKMKEEYVPLVEAVNNSNAKKVSLDLPSGISCDTGTVEGAAIRADYTVTFSALKFSQVQLPAMEYCGEIVVADVGIPEAAFENSQFAAKTTGLWALDQILQPRKKNTNKGSFGSLLCVCGSRGMAGAAMMSGKAASRCGVGLVHMALPASIYPIVATAVPEAVYTWLPEAVYTWLPEEGEKMVLSAAQSRLEERFEGTKLTACLIGCGLGVTELTAVLMETVLQQEKFPLVIDADGLNLLAAHPEWLKQIGGRAILTPHPGEMARLLKTTVSDVQNNRISYAREFAAVHQVVLVLKGANTVVASPNGEVYVNRTGNPGMAKAGSGDVLAGIIASLLAQGESLQNAAAGGVYLHGMAGDRCAAWLSQIGMTAPDLIDELPNLFVDLTL